MRQDRLSSKGDNKPVSNQEEYRTQPGNKPGKKYGLSWTDQGRQVNDSGRIG